MRLVDFDDRDSLPYFECVLKEVLRSVFMAGCSLCPSSTYGRYFHSSTWNLELLDGDVPFHSVSTLPPPTISDAGQP